MKDEIDVIVIGSGPAGLMAAGTSAAAGKRVLLIDKNERTGRKLRITGKGRCNVTNDCSAQEVIAAVPKNGKFLFSALNHFPPAETMRFFEERGIKLKTERGRRVFPASDSADEIADALEVFAKQNGVGFRRGTVQAILTEDCSVKGVKTAQGTFRAKNVIVACGGASYPGTGSNGDGARLASQAGHTIEPLTASLIPLVEKGDICPKLQGLALKNIAVKVTDHETGKNIFEDFGELLFTHFGLSGPTILSASAHMRGLYSGRYTVEIDLKPALDEKKLDARILRDLEENRNRRFGNSLDKLLPQKLIPVVIDRLGVDPEMRSHSITKEDRRALGHLLKHFTIEIGGFRPIAEAIVTSGGVSIKEISPKTMESKLIAGLFFAGEIIDVDAYTGGFNLQIAFATGHLAGQSAADSF